jgi:adenylate cyclase
MNRIIILLFILSPLFSAAQQDGPYLDLTHDSLFHNDGNARKVFIGKRWRFKETDDPSMASKEYDDSRWEIVNPDFRLDSTSKYNYRPFSSIGWFRLHIRSDSSITGIPLALLLTHFGASEIYFDGKKIHTFGAIKGDSSKYYDPQRRPFTIVAPAAGEHVVAIRYANYAAARNFKIYRESFAGFNIAIGPADGMIIDAMENVIDYTFYSILLFAIFTTFFVLHFLLYLFYRQLKANLFFSIFCLCLGIPFFIFYTNQTSHDPSVAHVTLILSQAIAAISCVSLSGFSNELFSPKKVRFRAIGIFCLITLIVCIFDNTGFSEFMFFVMICLVLVESIVLTIIAIRKKMKGARIIGSGILFFTLFISLMVLLSLRKDGLSFHEQWSADLFLYSALCAVLSIPVSMSVYLSWDFATINGDLKRQLRQVEVLSAQTLQHEQEKKKILEDQKDQLEREVMMRTAEVVEQKEKIEKQHDELKAEKNKSDELLRNILPEEVAEELKAHGYSKARLFNEVTVMFTDFVNFTSASEQMQPEDLVDELHTCFKAFDTIISKYGIEKIKTIGDAYLAVCGLPVPHAEHAVKTASAAMDILGFMQERRQLLGDKTFEVRVGLHSGNVIAGIVGVKKFAYDIWGDTVNTAARMEQNSIAGKINISQDTYDLIKGSFECTFRGGIPAKNKGELNMYFIEDFKNKFA